MKEQVKNVGRIIAIAAICFATLATTAFPVQAGPPGTPVGVYGLVFLSDGKTQVPYGTNLSVNDITNGFYTERTTGWGPFPGYYGVMIQGGSDGDTVIVKAWNKTHYGETTVSVNGVMRVDVVIDTPILKIGEPLNSNTNSGYTLNNHTPMNSESGGNIPDERVTDTTNTNTN